MSDRSEKLVTQTSDQTIEISLKPGSQVSIFGEVDIDEEGGFLASTVFEDTVEKYIPESHLLEFESSDVGYSEFVEMLQDNDSVQVVKE